VHRLNPSRRPPHEPPHKKPREQYLGSLKEPLNKTKEDHGSSTTPLQIRRRPDTNNKRTEKGRKKNKGVKGSKLQESKEGSTLKIDTQITSKRTRRKRNTKY
jgi:hypothetical protein